MSVAFGSDHVDPSDFICPKTPQIYKKLAARQNAFLHCPHLQMDFNLLESTLGYI